MENSDNAISNSFFENLWPLIIAHNECDIKSSNTCEYFIPQTNFDHIWAHELLAENCFDDYEPPVVLDCKAVAENRTENRNEEEIEQLQYRGPNADILSLDQQLEIIQQDVEVRKKLANDFANRKFPWYIQRPLYPYDFEITNEMKEIFKDKFEFEILQNIQCFKCRLMIIDVAPAVPLKNLDRWLKFSPYVPIVAVFHDKELCGKLKDRNNFFQPTVLEENSEHTWQDELERAIDLGVKKANELFLLDDGGRAMVFVFSQNRGICVCNKFKILRKS